MKKIFTLTLFLLLSITSSQAKDYHFVISDSTVVNLIFHLNKDTHTDKNPYPHTPVRMPSVCQNGHTLTFNYGCDNTILTIIDDTNEDVFSTSIEAGCESLALPSWLTGTFRLQIIRGNFTFEAEINL